MNVCFPRRQISKTKIGVLSIKQIFCNQPVATDCLFLKIVVEAMTSGLPKVSKLWSGVSKGMLPVKYLAPKILMAVNYCGCQQAQRLG